MHTTHCLVDGMLQDAFIALQEIQITLNIVIHLHVIQPAIVLSHEGLEVFHFLDKGATDIGCQIEVKSGDSLTAMHLVLGCFHRDAGDDASSLDALGRTRLTMACHIALLQHFVQRMLHASETLGGIIVLIMNMQIVATDSLTRLFAQEVIIDKGLSGLTGKLHHHARRGVCIHVGVLTRDIVVLGIDDFQEQVARLGLTRHTAFLTIVNVAARHLLAGALHQFQLHLVLNVLHTHLATTTLADTVSDALNESFVFAGFGGKHCLADCRFYLFLVIADNTAITLQYCLNHNLGAKI